MLGYFLIIFVFLQFKGLTDSQTIHVCTSGNGEQCIIYCETTDQSQNILFTHPVYGTAGGCQSSGACGSGLGYTADRVNSTFTRLTIPSLNCTADRGNWICSYGSSATSTPVMLPCPSSLDGGGGLTIDVTGNTVTCQLNCQSPISGFSSLQLHKIQSGTTSLLYTVTSITGSTPAAADGCNSDEQNVILSRDVSDICGPSKFRCTFNNIYLGSANSSESAEISLTDYNWHILVGWIVGVLIIPVAGLFCFIFNVFIVKKSHTKWSWDNQKKFKLVVGLALGAGVLLSLIVCIIIATQVCFSTFSSAFGVGIGVSFGIMFICVVIIVVILCTCMKGNEEEIGSEETGDRRKPTTETSKDTRKSDDKPLKTVGVAKPIVQDRPKSKALEDVPKTRPLPSPRKDDNEEKIIITKPSKLPPLDHENSTSSPKKKKKKKKSKENESENKEKVDSP